MLFILPSSDIRRLRTFYFPGGQVIVIPGVLRRPDANLAIPWESFVLGTGRGFQYSVTHLFSKQKVRIASVPENIFKNGSIGKF